MGIDNVTRENFETDVNQDINHDVDTKSIFGGNIR